MKNKEKSISSKIEIAGLPSSYGFMKDIRERNPEIGLLGGFINIEPDNFFKQIMDTSDKIEIIEIIETKWIKLSDKKPTQYETVLTYGHPINDGIGITICTHADGIFRFKESEKENKHTITHWAKLPIPPKEETDDSGYWDGAHYK